MFPVNGESTGVAPEAEEEQAVPPAVSSVTPESGTTQGPGEAEEPPSGRGGQSSQTTVQALEALPPG